MQIALVAVVLLAGMWFTVLKPKPDAGASAPVAAAPAADASSAPVAPGTKGLASAVDKAKAASATSDAANAKLQAATAGPAAAAKPAAPVKAQAKANVTKPAAAARKPGTKAATAVVDPSQRLLAYLAKGKTLVVLFYGDGADDAAARQAVHRTALKDTKNVVSAYVPISQVGRYDAITREVSVMTFPTVLVIGADRKATSLTGFLDTRTVQQAVGDSRRGDAAAAAAKSSK